jgi:L-ornithine N5-monooxygenase
MTTEQHASLVGVGFGPAGIALAAALADNVLLHAFEDSEDLARHAVFFERAKDSAWQPGMVLPGTDIQHHFLRDFGTPRDPDSYFGFVRYIHERDRFYSFTLRGGYVTRAEWSDYCEWAASRTISRICYNHDVETVEPVRDEAGTLQALRVTARDTGTGQAQSVTTRRLVLATGHEPYVPEEFRAALGRRVFHSTTFSMAVPKLGDVRSAVVIGGGQNAGEVLLHLYNSTGMQLHSIVRNSGFRLYDLGHFANQAYWPAETDYFHALEPGARKHIFDEQYRTNYAAVDPDVSTGLYNAWYDGEVSGNQRLNMLRRQEVLSLTDEGDHVRVTVRDRYVGGVQELRADMVVLCTGFREPAVPSVLRQLQDHLVIEADGRLAVDRDFRTPLREAEDVSIFLNGMSESRHGIASATSFSLMAQRAGEITRTLSQIAPVDILQGATP